MGIAEGFRLYCAPQSVLKVPVTKVEDEYIVSPGYVFWMPRIRVVSGCRARVYGTWLPQSGRCGARSAGRWRVSVFGAWGGRQLAYCCRVCSCCLGGITTIGVRHAGDTPSRGSMVVKPPDECWVVRWMVGVVLNVQSTSAACAEKVVFGSKWTT